MTRALPLCDATSTAMFAGRSSVVAGGMNRLAAVSSRLLPRSLMARMTPRVSRS